MALKYKVQAGETANSIAKKYGYANYKDAGINLDNPDQIGVGQEIELSNYDPSAISTIKTGSPVISSYDAEGEYKKQSTALDGKLNPTGTGEPVEEAPMTSKERREAERKQKEDAKNKGNEKPETSGDPIYDEYLTNSSKATEESERWAEAERKRVQALLPSTLAAIDQQYAATSQNVMQTYEKLIVEQQRINRIDVDRTKAYGLQAGGQYMPMEFTSAVSGKEQEAANEIASLEGERTNLLAQARAARDQGKITALRANMEDLQKIEDRMRSRTKDLQDQVTKRYDLMTKVREDKEKRHQETVSKVLQAASIKYLDKFKDAKTPQEKDAIIKQILMDSGGQLTQDDYYSVYSGLSTAITDAEDAALKRTKAELDIDNVRNTMANRNESTAIARAREARLAREEGSSNIFEDINALLQEVDEDGEPYTDPNDFITPGGFKKLISAAKEDGVDRATFLEEYGALLYEGDDDYAGYNLTQAEKDKLTGSGR